jgi:hypothetical protein
MKTKEQLGEDYGDIHMEKFDLTKAHHLPFQYNDRNKVERAFLSGYEACLKTIKDKINALKSKLAAEKTEKMSKILNQDLIKELEVKIKTLEEFI